MILVNPMNEAVRQGSDAPPRLTSLAGKTIGLLDISKPGGDVFLDRLAALLGARFGVARVERFRKPTFAKPAPQSVMDALLEVHPDAVIEGLAD